MNLVSIGVIFQERILRPYCTVNLAQSCPCSVFHTYSIVQALSIHVLR